MQDTHHCQPYFIREVLEKKMESEKEQWQEREGGREREEKRD
jgi:hypothetical protein